MKIKREMRKKKKDVKEEEWKRQRGLSKTRWELKQTQTVPHNLVFTGKRI